MEFLLIAFDSHDPRDVLVEDIPIGRTGRTLMVEPGTYTVTLSGNGYLPLSWRGPVFGTSVNRPKRIQFFRG
jgi:PEGA domain